MAPDFFFSFSLSPSEKCIMGENQFAPEREQNTAKKVLKRHREGVFWGAKAR
jgi:hypothetical protein